MPRLHIFFGAGGVGKTTLSAGLAVHLARQGRRTGLLSIDPARRLQSALGGTKPIDEAGTVLLKEDNGGELRAAMLKLDNSLRRWIAEVGLSPENERQLFAHPFFHAVAEKIATATETLAPARMAEWLEHHPDTDDLIIDTAPGLHAVDFLDRPDRLLSFLDSKILQWLKWFAGDARDANIFQKAMRSGAQGILKALGKAGGENILLGLGELLLMLDQVLYRMLERLHVARDLVRAGLPRTRIYLVCAIRDDSVAVANSLRQVLQSKDLKPAAVILNRTIPDDFRRDPGLTGALHQDRADLSADENLYYDFVRGMLAMQNNVEQLLAGEGRVCSLPILPHLEQRDQLRLRDLEQLGAALENRLNVQP
ncbi:MAG: hypothetical protein KDK30_02865 [Leptospiraceae bacterium]|nr:hypothetical protein [Leptospiraceae bacterium]